MPIVSTASSAAQVAAHYNLIGPNPILKIFDGYEPQSITSPDSGTLLVSMTLPAEWASVFAGVLTSTSTWSGTAVATGEARHYRLYASNGVCHEQGYISDGNYGQPQITSGDTVQIQAGQYKLANIFIQNGGGA